MKNLICLTIVILYCLTTQCQTISPLQSNEYCPNTEFTFTVTITKTYLNMIGENGGTVTQLPNQPVGTTFTFKGKFGDINQKQIFRVNYTDGSSTPFEFKKIKSLFHGTCTPLQPNQSSVPAAPCTIGNYPISFSNVQWKTEFESPALCFGSITAYEYLLPSGWSMNGTTSNGSTWINGDNSETVTSDLLTGRFAPHLEV